jgi:hypothetical protein
MLMEEFFNAVDRAFTKEADRILSPPFRLELKSSLELPLSAPEGPPVARSSERRRASQHNPLARIIHIFEDNKGLLCYKHVV